MQIHKHALAKLEKNGFRLYLTPDGSEAELRNDQVKIFGVPGNTIETCAGVFGDEIYAFSGNGDYVAYDIGFNIGAASLYYALYGNVRRIYAFEPFAATFDAARKNLAANPTLAHKISAYNFGLGNRNEWREIHYNKNLPGSMSTVADRFAQAGTAERVEIRDASEVLAPLFGAHPENILMKMDCEGSEREILSSLAHSGLLRKVDAIVMEWHFAPPAYLNKLLNKNGFFVFYSHYVPNELGMLRAFRR